MSNGNWQEDYHQAGQPAEEREIGALEALWFFFSSMKTAIALLLLLAATSIAATIIEEKTGKRIYGDPWFQVLLCLVGVNLAVCSVNRFGLVWRSVFHPNTLATPDQVSRMPGSRKVTCTGSGESASDRVKKVLHSRHYRVVSQTAGGSVSIYADRGRAGLWGPHITHLSLLVIFAGAIYGSFLGSEGRMDIVEGTRADSYVANQDMKIGKRTPLGFEVALRSFSIKYDKNHMPVGFKSDLQVYDGGREATHRVIDVNHPLSYRGMSFYQASYGLVGLVMKVTAPDGTSTEIPWKIATEDTDQGAKYTVSGEPFKQFQLGGKNLTLFVHNLVPDFIGGDGTGGSTLPLNPAVNVMVNDRFPKYKGLDAWGQLGWMTVSKSAEYKGYTITLDRVVKYTLLQVSRNPGLPVIYFGFFLTVLGVILCFYVTHKVIRITVTRTGEQVVVVLGGTSKPEPAVVENDLKHLTDALA